MNITFEREWCSFLLGKYFNNNRALYFEKCWGIGDSFVNVSAVIFKLCKLQRARGAEALFEHIK